MKFADLALIWQTRQDVMARYKDEPTGCGGSFGELLCYEIHIAGLTFVRLAAKWEISVTLLGDLIAYHCRRMEE